MKSDVDRTGVEASASPKQAASSIRIVTVRNVLLALWFGALLPFTLVAAEVVAVAPQGDSFGLMLSKLVVGLGGLASFAGILGAPFLLWQKSTRSVAVVWLLFALPFVATICYAMGWSRAIRRDAFAQLEVRSQPLIAAISAYETKHGRPPRALTDLVPEFLPEVPSTGMGAYPEYDYVVGAEATMHYDGNSWVLYVFTPNGGINFDRFLYLPNRNYPDHGYGGWLERFDAWAYVHE